MAVFCQFASMEAAKWSFLDTFRSDSSFKMRDFMSSGQVWEPCCIYVYYFDSYIFANFVHKVKITPFLLLFVNGCTLEYSYFTRYFGLDVCKKYGLTIDFYI